MWRSSGLQRERTRGRRTLIFIWQLTFIFAARYQYYHHPEEVFFFFTLFWIKIKIITKSCENLQLEIIFIKFFFPEFNLFPVGDQTCAKSRRVEISFKTCVVNYIVPERNERKKLTEYIFLTLIRKFPVRLVSN